MMARERTEKMTQGVTAGARRANAKAGVLRTIAEPDGLGPMWQQIRRVLARPILSGEWPPGTRIPPELDLIKRFRTSRVTVGKAVQSLANEGFVERNRKLGTVVADRAQERPVFDVWDIQDLVTRAGGSYGYKLLECRKLTEDTERRELLGVSRRTPTLWLMCLHMSDGRPFQLEERLINIDAAPGVTCRPLDSVSPGLWLLGNVPWTDAEHKISALEAPPEVAQHLGTRPGAACLVVDRRTWNDGTPVTYARLWQSGAQHSLVGHFEPAC
jgi:GntR family transcriptional regulator, histidine utilization repressor